MSLTQITVLQDIPKFTGNPKIGEPKFVPEIDARTFLRTLENHFSNEGITSDEKKLQIFFSLIDKKKRRRHTTPHLLCRQESHVR